MKDLIEVGKCRVSEILPKDEHVMSRNREKSHERASAKCDQTANRPAPYRHKKSDRA